METRKTTVSQKPSTLVVGGSHLQAMERSPINDTEIKSLLFNALTDKINDREIFIKGLDASYFYEDYIAYRSKDLI